MRHVLEHFSRPDLVLEKIKKVLSPGGLVYIAVPDSLNPQPTFSDAFVRVVHTYYFNKTSLTNLLYKSGLGIASIHEGDRYYEELFVFAKQPTEQGELLLTEDTYKVQHEVFTKCLAEEKTLTYKLKRLLSKGINFIVKIKKAFFPQPIVKREDIC